MLIIPKKIEEILFSLEQRGFKAYIVGGCVRDMLMGKTPHDFDITTSALPENVISIFRKTVPTGIKHGTVTVINGSVSAEVTTFRTESGYSDSRHPERVSFVSDLSEDLSRRDFTVNAMAYNKTDGLQDFFGGLSDIENKVLRAVGDPEKRFSEDALRIMRLFRFAAVLNFAPEKKTLSAALEFADRLSFISAERVMTELLKALATENPEKIAPLTDGGYLSFAGINNSPDYEKIKKTPRNDINLRLFMFLNLSGSNIEETLTYLKASNSIKKNCADLKLLTSLPVPLTKSQIKERLNNTGEKVFLQYIEYLSAYENPNTVLVRNMFKEIIEKGEPYRINQLKIDGNILKEKGIKGEKIGSTLEHLRKKVVENQQFNNREKLIDEALKINRN